MRIRVVLEFSISYLPSYFVAFLPRARFDVLPSCRTLSNQVHHQGQSRRTTRACMRRQGELMPRFERFSPYEPLSSETKSLFTQAVARFRMPIQWKSVEGCTMHTGKTVSTSTLLCNAYCKQLTSTWGDPRVSTSQRWCKYTPYSKEQDCSQILTLKAQRLAKFIHDVSQEEQDRLGMISSS